MKFPQHILLLFLTIVLISCKDETKSVTPTNMVFEMPPYTDTGANVLAYKTNGVVYRNYDYTGSSDEVMCMRFIDIDAPEKGYILYLEGNTIEKDIFHSVNITIQGVDHVGRYYLKQSNIDNRNAGEFKIGRSELIFSFFNTTDEYTGYIDITKLDTTNNIVAGRFDFKTKFNDFGTPSIDTFAITSGQFDLKYYQ